MPPVGRPPKGQKRHLVKQCQRCAREFKVYLAFSGQKFCSKTCYGAHKAGKPVLSKREYAEMSKRFTGSSNPNWKGGPEHNRMMHREWCRKNPELAAARKHRRRAAKRQATGSFTAEEWAAIKAAHGYRCAGCNNPETLFDVLTVDHITPLSKGGSNDAANIQPLCLRCNSSKRDLPDPKWREKAARKAKAA